MQFKWNQKKKNSKVILLGSILDNKGRWSCFLVLDGMRLCECFDFFSFK